MTRRLSNTILVLSILCVVIVVASVGVLAVNANNSNNIMGCMEDRNGNGVVDISELFDAIDAYFSQTPCFADDSSEWTVSNIDDKKTVYTVVSQEHSNSGLSPWWLSAECSASGRPAVFMGKVWAEIFTNVDNQELDILVDIDGVRSEQTWDYYERSGINSDYLSLFGTLTEKEQLLMANEVTYTIPANPNDFIVSFAVAGLDQHLESLSAVCQNDNVPPEPTATPRPTATPTPEPTATPTPTPPVSQDNGDWIFFGPDCPDAYPNCAPFSSQSTLIGLTAYADSNEEIHDNDAYMFVDCAAGNPYFNFSGGGPPIDIEAATLNIRYLGQPTSEGTWYLALAIDAENEFVWFSSNDTRAILQFIEQADNQNNDVLIEAVFAVDGGTHEVFANFDVTGFTINFQRLPCS